MRLSEHDVAGRGPEVAEARDGVDGELDPLAGAEEAPGEDHRAPRGIRGTAAALDVARRAVLDHDHLLRVDVVGLEQPDACDGALGDDSVGGAGEAAR